VAAGQNCGNILAGVGPFAIESGLAPARDCATEVCIHMVNTGSVAIATVQTPDGVVRYDGTARIDGVPGTAAPVPTRFLDVAGSSCGALLPTGNARDEVVILRAADFGLSGHEPPEVLEGDAVLKARLEAIRLDLGPRMNLGDVTSRTVPKMCLVSPPQGSGVIGTRTFIPHRVHEAIGVLGAVSVATACLVPGSVAAEVAGLASADGRMSLEIEHPTGFFTVDVDVALEGAVVVRGAALLRTARKLMSGHVYVPASVWDGLATAGRVAA
jgi:4-oxalomesaconate tautomerase